MNNDHKVLAKGTIKRASTCVAVCAKACPRLRVCPEGASPRHYTLQACDFPPHVAYCLPTACTEPPTLTL